MDPLRTGDSAKAWLQEAPPEERALVWATGKEMQYKPHIMIIGNDEDVMELIVEQLKKAFRSCVLECTSALSIACNSLANTTFDVILLDLSVANHGKDAAVATIRSVARETPLFLLLDKRCGSPEAEPHGLGTGGFLFKGELKQETWVELHIEGCIYGKAIRDHN